MPVAKYSDPREFLDMLHALQSVRSSGTWYFRGQADASWRLVPSLFRRHIRDEPAFERALLGNLRVYLQERSTLPERLISKDDYLLALAQHYRAPTRVLDWSLSPLVAAYFAASGALERCSGGHYLAVFAIADITSESHKIGETTIIHPPSGGNENLVAQSGVLVKHDWKCRDYWRNEYEGEVERPDKNVNARLDSRCIRLELPVSRASDLLLELAVRGVDGVALFPGMHGFVAAALDATWEAEFRDPSLTDKVAREVYR